MTRKYGFIIYLIPLWGMTALPAFADGTLRFETRGEIRPHTVFVGDGRVRMEAGGESSKRVSIYDSRSEEMVVLDPAQQTYSRLDQEAVEQQFQKMSAMREQMQQAMKEATPEERAIMKKSLEQMGMEDAGKNATPAPKLHSEKSGEQKTVGEVPCMVYHTYIGEEQVGSACLADRKSLDLSPQDFQTLAKMYDFTRRVQNIAARAQVGMGKMPVNTVEEFYGMPISVSSTANGEESRLVEVSHEPVAKEMFQVPSNYKQQGG